MRRLGSGPARRFGLGLLGSVLLWLLPATTGAGSAAALSGSYLATGDSIAFGTNLALDPGNADHFVGYPTPVAQALGLALANSSCPGETSGHFISLSGPDLVCGLYRSTYPLHLFYTTSQLDFSLAFLRAHPDTRLVSIDIGANDLFRLELVCATGRTAFTFQDIVALAESQNVAMSPQVGSCVLGRLPQALLELGRNLDRIYGAWRAAGYRGPIVALTVYSTDYADLAVTGLVAAMDQVIAAHTLAFGGRVADGFGAFAAAAATAGGDACKAGLLNPLPPQLGVTGCDVHPSARGRQVLAGAVLRAA
ncbi:MAG TPA: GDSL-type esterase/lipase family protein [Candidatus Dormibacteraeota bacterium]|nr:GDSL-type esterase/lipase family protein [Candidatus Dormibacteraeota bacterium]